MKRTLLTLFFLSASSLTYGLTGNEWLSLTESDDQMDNIQAIAYIDGVADVYRVVPSPFTGVCLRFHRNVTLGQTRDVVIKYLRDNPDRRQYPTPWLASTALESAFGAFEPDANGRCLESDDE